MYNKEREERKSNAVEEGGIPGEGREARGNAVKKNPGLLPPSTSSKTSWRLWLMRNIIGAPLPPSLIRAPKKKKEREREREKKMGIRGS